MNNRRFYFLFVMAAFLLCRPVFAQDYVLDKRDTSEVRFINKKKFYIYKVEKGETVYSITKKFSVTEAELLEFNPELKDGLKNKMKLWVPAVTAVAAPVLAPEPEKAPPEKNVLKLALLLPFYLDKSTVQGDLLNDSLLLSETLNKETTASLEFYEGLLYALDQPGRDKLKVVVQVFDTQDDTLVTAKILRNPAVISSNLVFVSAGLNVLKQVSRFSLQQKIPVASVSMHSAEAFRDNPNAIVILPSSLMQCRQMGKAASSFVKGSQCVVVRSSVPKEAERSKAFISGWSEANSGTVTRELTEKNLPALADSLSSVRHNIIFVPSSNEDFVSSLLVELGEVPVTRQFTLVGIPTWQYFETISPALMEKMNTCLFSTSSIDYENQTALQFRRHCREKYGNEPSDQAFQGFDAMNMMAAAWKKDAKDFLDELQKGSYTGLFTTYHFVPAGGCTENDVIYVVT